MTDQPVIHWFRRDLRLGDNLALREALKRGAPVIALYIFDPNLLKSKRNGLPRLSLLLQGLHAVDEGLRTYGTRLLVRHGDPRAVLREVVEETGAKTVYFNRDYSPYAVRRDEQISADLGVEMIGCDDAVLHAPGDIMKSDGKPFVVFTPFKNRWKDAPKPAIAGGEIENRQFHTLDGFDTPDLPTLHNLGFEKTFRVPIPAGETAAKARLKAFASNGIFSYAVTRNRLIPNPFDDPPPEGTAYISPYLRLGMLSPRQAYAAAQDALTQADDADQRHSIEVWMTELAWREFYLHILYHFPHVLTSSFQPDYDRVPFRDDDDDFDKWAAGITGYPIVDAAMRQMNTIGWMHNRARMIVASFLTKDLLIYWRRGDDLFMQKLMDGDPAANNGGWQWVASTGTDAQPYFRIFNPVSQSKQYDPTGAYIRYYVPELRDVPDKHIHAPWEMDTPPADYPPPMVDHAIARQRALDAYKSVRRGDEPTPPDNYDKEQE